MVIEPFKINGKVPSNVELVRIFYDKLQRLRDGVGAKSSAEKRQMEDRFYSICGGSQNANEVMSFMKQVVDAPNDDIAQDYIARGIIGSNVK